MLLIKTAPKLLDMPVASTPLEVKLNLSVEPSNLSDMSSNILFVS